MVDAEVGEAGVPAVVGRKQHGALAVSVALDRLAEIASQDRSRHALGGSEPRRVERVGPREEGGGFARSSIHRREREVAQLSVVAALAKRGGEHGVLAEVPLPVVGEQLLEGAGRRKDVAGLALRERRGSKMQQKEREGGGV